MSQRTPRIPGTLRHTNEPHPDESLQAQAREHLERQPGLQFLTDVLRALHGHPEPLRNAEAFFAAFPPREVMEAFSQRADLRVKTLKAITGSPAALLRRLPPDALASQIDILASDDLPEAERGVRAEGDRSLSVTQIYFKYLDPADIAAYLPAQAIWAYEARDEWWRREPSPATRALMAIELRSIRRRAIMTDSEILDLLGDEALERHLSLSTRTALRKASRRAAAEGRPFTDSELFSAVGGAGGGRDLIDEMVENIPMFELREVVDQGVRMLGLTEQEASPARENTPAPSREPVPTPVGGTRIGPKGAVAAAPLPGPGKAAPAAAPNDQRRPPPAPPPKKMPSLSSSKADRAAAPASGDDGPPQPDDDFTFVDEVSGA